MIIDKKEDQKRAKTLLAVEQEIRRCIEQRRVTAKQLRRISRLLEEEDIAPPQRRGNRQPLRVIGCDAPAGSWDQYFAAWDLAVRYGSRLSAANNESREEERRRRFFLGMMRDTLRAVTRVFGKEFAELSPERMCGIAQDAISKNEDRMPLASAVAVAAVWAISSVIKHRLLDGRITPDEAEKLVDVVLETIEDEGGEDEGDLNSEEINDILNALEVDGVLPRIRRLCRHIREADEPVREDLAA